MQILEKTYILKFRGHALSLSRFCSELIGARQRHSQARGFVCMGQLRNHPLAELIREISAAALTGALRLERDRARIVIYIEDGRVVLANSNLRAHRVLEYLKRVPGFAERFNSDQNLADDEILKSLVERGVLKEDSASQLRARQTLDIVRAGLLWTDGTWEFDPRIRVAEGKVEVRQINQPMMEWARRLPDSFLATRFRNANEKLSTLFTEKEGIELLPAEAFILSRLDIPLYVHQLISLSGLPETEAVRACYVLSLGGLIEREMWPAALSKKDVDRALAFKARYAGQEEAVVSETKPETKGQVEHPVPAEPEISKEEELAAFLERATKGRNNYEVMGVPRSAKQDVLKKTYLNLARNFHPDLFHHDPKLRLEVESAFAKVANAYEVLRDKKTRAAYDVRLLQEEQFEKRHATSRPVHSQSS